MKNHCEIKKSTSYCLNNRGGKIKERIVKQILSDQISMLMRIAMKKNNIKINSYLFSQKQVQN
jgi:hypothetical protein